MTARPVVLHLVDDHTAGGVMRVVDFMRTSPAMAACGDHRVRYVKRGKVLGNLPEADIIVSHLAVSWRTLPALIALRASNASKPLLHVEHSYTEAFVALNVRNRRRFSALLRIAFSLFDRVVAVSHAQASWIISRGFCPAKKLATIQSCVDLADFRNVSASAGPARIFGAIGRLDSQKGFDTLIHAFRSCSNPDIQLHIYGEGVEEPLLRTLAGGDERISFKGFASDPAAPFAQVDAVVMPSRWEAYGLVAIEALSAGKRLICSDTDGLRDHQARGAQLVRAGSINDLRAKLIDLSSQRVTTAPISPFRQTNVLENCFAKKWAELISGLAVSG